MSRLNPALILVQVHCPTLTKHRETDHKCTDAGSTMCCVHMMDCHSEERCVSKSSGRIDYIPPPLHLVVYLSPPPPQLPPGFRASSSFGSRGTERQEEDSGHFHFD